MNELKIKQLAKVMLTQSLYFQNYIAKFGFVSMLEYKPQTTEMIEKDLTILSPSCNTLYIVDIENPHHYLKSILNQNIYPIPLFHHVWHNRGVVGTSQMYNTLLDEELYLNLSDSKPCYNSFCLVFDGGRDAQGKATDVSTYNNMWSVYDEMLPPLAFLEGLKINQVKIICDQKRSDLIVSCTNLYDQLVEVEVV